MAAPRPPEAPVTTTSGASAAVAAAGDTGAAGAAMAGGRDSCRVKPMKISAVGRWRPASCTTTFTVPVRSPESHETISP